MFVELICSQVAKYAKTTSATVGGRRALGSSVGAVLQHNVDEEEEGYDPRKPAIGNVASVIKVTERRYDCGFIMAALRSRCGRYIFALWFLLSSFFLA